MGLESGSQEVLDKVKKRSSVEDMVTAVQMADEAGIKSSVIVLLGLGSRELSRKHIKSTVKALNRMQTRYLSFLSLMLIEGTPLAQAAERGEFEELDSHELLQEAHDILKGLKMKKTIFRSNHASNYLALEGRLPHDKSRLITTLNDA